MGRLQGVEPVADHRADHDHARRAAQRLREAQQREAVDAVGERAARRREREQAEPGEERPLAPEAVREGAEGELPQPHAEQVSRHGVLHARGADREFRFQGRQRRQVHVQGERPGRHDRPEHEREPGYPFTHSTCLRLYSGSTRSAWLAITSSMSL